MRDRQRLFAHYPVAVPIDLILLNLFDEFWDLVTIHPFSVAVLAAEEVAVRIDRRLGRSA